MTDFIFSYVLRPYALGVKSLSVLMAPMSDGDFEAFALCESTSGHSDAIRLTFHKTMLSELGFACGALEEALRYVKSPTLLNAIVHVKPPRFAV